MATLLLIPVLTGCRSNEDKPEAPSPVKVKTMTVQSGTYATPKHYSGTVEEEKIIHAAGADTGQKMTTAQLEQVIRAAGYIPVQRDSLYNEIK